jgi:hypothetical protein
MEDEAEVFVDVGGGLVAAVGGKVHEDAAEAVDRTPSSVSPVPSLRLAASERCALAMTLGRSAAAASGSVSP